MTIVIQLIDLNVNNSYQPLASSFELDLSLKQLEARGSQLAACDLEQSLVNSSEKE
jgi:hypothetical protein